MTTIKSKAELIDTFLDRFGRLGEMNSMNDALNSLITQTAGAVYRECLEITEGYLGTNPDLDNDHVRGWNAAAKRIAQALEDKANAIKNTNL